MKAIDQLTGKEIFPGDTVKIYKYSSDYSTWLYTNQMGIFEELTPSGHANFTLDGKQRQCLPEGIGAKIEYGAYYPKN